MTFRQSKHLLVLLIAFLSYAYSTNPALKCVSDDTTSLKRGDTVVICVHLPELGKKVPFTVDVDKYSALDLKGGFAALKSGYLSSVNSSGGYSVVVQGPTNSIQSDKLVYYIQSTSGSTTINKTFTIYSAVINIDGGKITGITWDNGCWSGSGDDVCYAQQVIGATTYTEKNNFIKTCSATSNLATNDGTCDPKIFVSWIGTDSSGNYMTSAGLRMSRFASYSIGELYSSSKSLFTA